MIDMKNVTAMTLAGQQVTKIEKDGVQIWPTPSSAITIKTIALTEYIHPTTGNTLYFLQIDPITIDLSKTYKVSYTLGFSKSDGSSGTFNGNSILFGKLGTYFDGILIQTGISYNYPSTNNFQFTITPTTGYGNVISHIHFNTYL